MNQIFKIFCLIALIGFAACQNTSNTQANEVEENLETKENDNQVINEMASTVLNPNLATKEELEKVISSDSIVASILASRPYLAMSDLDQQIGNAMDSTEKAELYSKLFVPQNLNTTPEADFKLIPGVGDRMAHEFEEYRPYIKIEQFRKEIGKYVDEAEVARYENYVFVPVELNTASKEEILAIPGVGERMHHEFEEYRPYKNMDQFRKEIGKYVDDKELARLERYVYISNE